MDKTERLRLINHGLSSGRCMRRSELQVWLEVSASTLKRDIAYLRDHLDTPVVWDEQREGWRLERRPPGTGVQYELPGLWVSAEEIYALLTVQQLLTHLDKGELLGPYIPSLMRKLTHLIDGQLPTESDVARRIRVQTVGSRNLHLPHFQALCAALLRRRRLHLRYVARSSGDVSDRVVSPQRLVHYRDNWYLDAWCHSRQALRSFSADAVQLAQLLDQAAIDVPDTQLDAVLGVGYGIFSGARVQWAQLRFSAERARWVSAERWHANQIGRRDEQGRWLLTLPYADPRELVMDILRHMPDVEVIAPDELRDEVLRRLREGLKAQGVDE